MNYIAYMRKVGRNPNVLLKPIHHLELANTIQFTLHTRITAILTCHVTFLLCLIAPSREFRITEDYTWIQECIWCQEYCRYRQNVTNETQQPRD